MWIQNRERDDVMRKRILSVLLCLVMLTGLFPAAALAADEEAEGPTAQVGGQTYSSLKAAITAAGEGGTITLLRDYRQQGDEDAVLLDLTDKTLDLNGFTYHFGYACHFTGSNGTIKNGAMTIDDNSNDTWALAVNGPYADHFTIDGVTLNKGILIQHGTDVQLNDLTVTTPERNDAAAVQINGGCSATITGGSYTATGYAASAVHNNLPGGCAGSGGERGCAGAGRGNYL